jgi:hypothetical protein
MTKVTYICCSAKTKKQLLTPFIIFLNRFFNAFFGRFVTKGVRKHGKKSIWAHHRKCGFCFVHIFFPPSAVWFDFFYRVFGRFVTNEVQKRD